MNAIYALTYGVFMLSTRSGDKVNGCITNTCMQVASDPVRIAVSVLNRNYTCDLIKESGIFAVSLLSQECSYETISYWGHQSGRDVDKMADIPMPEDCQGVPYLGWHSCAVLSAKVVEQHDLGSHTLFIAEVVDAKLLNDLAPLRYSEYHERLKPRPADPLPDKTVIGWRCRICGYVYEGAQLPADFVCPLCGHGPDDFEPIYA